MAPRTTYGNTWWGAAWLRALTEIDAENRLPRGRHYLSSGRVRNLELTGGGTVKALVDGSAYYPYRVSVTLPATPPTKVKRLADRIARDPDLIAALLDGELPPEIADLCEALDLELFPRSSRSLKVFCSCPDSARICKHIAALIYGISVSIDNDPFVIFRLRGFDLRKELKDRGIDLDAAVKLRALTIDEMLERLVQGRPEMELAASGAGTEEDDGARVEAALRGLRALPLAVPKNVLEDILALFPDALPRSNQKKLPEWWRKAHRAMARAIRRRIDEAALADDAEESPSGETTEFFLPAQAPAEIRLEAPFQVARSTKCRSVFDLRLRVRGKRTGTPLPWGNFARALLELPPRSLETLPVDYELWHAFLLAAAGIFAGGAVIPVVLQDADSKGKPASPAFFWFPALRSPEVSERFDALCREAAPLAERLFDGALLPEGPRRIERTVLLALTLSIRALVEMERDELNLQVDDIAHAMFLAADLTKIRFDEPEDLSAAFARALRVFTLGDALPWQPVLTLRTLPQTADISVNFGLLPRGAARPVLLSTVLNDAAWENDRFAALSILKTLAGIEPELEAIRQSGGRNIHLESGHLRDFLFSSVAHLRLLGVVVRMPEALKKILRPRLVGSLSDSGAVKKGEGVLTLSSMLEFSWQIAVGDETLSLEALERMAQKAGQIVRVGENFIYLDPEEIEAMRRTLEGKDPSPLEKLRAALTGSFGQAEVMVADTLRERLRQMTAVEDLPPPETLTATLRPYQLRGFSWLMKNLRLGLGSLIADDMGLGKTLQVIAAVTELKAEGELEKKKVLCVVPTTLLTNWVREIGRFSPGLTTAVYHGPSRVLPDEAAMPDVLLTSYGTLRNDLEKFVRTSWRLLVIDEAQAVKNHASETNKAVRNVKTRQVIAMSGTPVENRLMEYWSILSIVQPRLLGTQADFRKTFALPIESEHDPQAVEAFRRVTAPFMLRRLKSDRSIIADLPDKIVQDQFTTLTAEQAALYQATLERAMERIKKAEAAGGENEARMLRRGLVLKLLTELKQICNSPSQFLGKTAPEPDSGKAGALFEILRQCRDAGRKALIFTQYREMGERLQQWIARATGRRPDFLHGGVPLKARTAMVDRFQTVRPADILIVSLKAGGTGLNLTAASTVIHYDLWWNPAVENQATDRAFRIGQKRDVLVYRFICEGTFEEKINRMLEEKRELADLTVATGETWIGNLGNEELERIFTFTARETEAS